MDNEEKLESIENDAIEMPFTPDEEDIFSEASEVVEEITPEQPDVIEEVKEETPIEEIVEIPTNNVGPIIDERIANNPIYNKTVTPAETEDKVGSGISLSDNSNMILDDRIKNNPVYQNVTFGNSDSKVEVITGKGVIEKDNKSIFDKNIFNLKHKSILLPVIAFVFASVIGIYLFVSSSKAETVNLIKINESNKVGYMDSDGTIVVKSKYLSGTEYYNGFAVVKNDNNLYCVLNGKGVFEVPCGNYVYIGLYDGRYIASKVTNQGLKQALLDKNLDNITKFKYDNIAYINNSVFTFKRDETVGLLNGEGKEIYSFKVDEVDDKNISVEVSNSKSNTKYAKIKVNDSSTIINLETGKEVYKYTVHEISVSDNNIFSIRNIEKDTNTFIYIEDDEVKFKTDNYKFVRVDDYNSNIAICIKNDSKIDYVNLTNQDIINNNANNDYYYHDGIILEKTHDFNLNADVYNILNYTGKIGSFNSLKPDDNLYYNDMLKIQVFENRFNFVNSKGKTISEKSYEYAENFEENGYAVVANNEKYGILNSKANEVVSLSYKGMEQLDSSLFKTLKKKYDLELFIFTDDNNKKGFVTSKNKEYIGAMYSSIEVLDDDYPFVKAYYGSDPVLLNLSNKKEINISENDNIQIKENYVIVNNKYYNYNGKLIYTAK